MRGHHRIAGEEGHQHVEDLLTEAGLLQGRRRLWQNIINTLACLVTWLPQRNDNSRFIQ
jgi:hypothetical protein